MSVGRNTFGISKDPFIHVASFLNSQDSISLSAVNKECQTAAKKALESHSKAIRSYPQNTYLGKMALRHPVARANGKEIPLVLDVIGNLQANKHLLEPKDWKALGIKRQRARVTNPFLNFSIEKLNLAGEIIEQRKKDISLVRAFTKILKEIPADQHPQLEEGTVSEQAEMIRAWMPAHQLLLDDILKLNLSSSELIFVPEELRMLTNLESLDLRGNKAITHLPPDFNPPNLRILNLKDTGITQLPDNFNPPNLTDLDLRDTTIITHFPERFNPPNLRGLYLGNTRITHLPASLTLQNMDWEDRVNLKLPLKIGTIAQIFIRLLVLFDYKLRPPPPKTLSYSW